MHFRWWLVGAAALCSLAQLVVTPPFQHPDEPAHYARILQLGRGELIATKTEQGTGAFFPSSWVRALKFLSHVPFHGDVRVTREEVRQEAERAPRLSEDFPRDEFYPFHHMALYSPMPYLPQLFGLAAAKMARMSLLQGLYVVRFFNWFFSFAALITALWLLQEHGRAWWVVLLTLCTPMGLALYASPSSDAILLSLSGVVVALGVTRRTSLPVVLALAFFFSASKLIFFLIPLSLIARFVHGFRRNLLFIGAAAILPNLTWMLATRGLYSPFRPGVSAPDQLAHVLVHPFDVMVAVLSTVADKWKYWVSSGVGILGWLDVPIRNSFHYGVAASLFLLVGWPREDRPRMDRWIMG
ncbi:MAG: DUF2142 domain-containing protein, partial [Bdellovibrionales bacterium]|nr:DUF2142 domain-containing protein [Bdellovibrionales bacterium]